MKKLVTAIFAVALLAGAVVSASAYEYTIGGQVGFDYASGGGESINFFKIAPEFSKIIDENTNVGIGLSYSTGERILFVTPDIADIFLGGMGGPMPKTTTLGAYLFAERAVLNPGPFKVYLRGDIGYRHIKLDDFDDNINLFSIGITPNVQYDLTDRLTLIVSSDVLRLGFDYIKPDGDNNISLFGFNTGKGAITSVGLKYAF